jgi:hypothetical protein
VKPTILLTLLGLTLGLGTARATIIGTTNPNAFTEDSINWCQQFGCLNNFAQFSPPQPWISNGGATGTVDLHNRQLQNFINFQQGITWPGNFPAGMGLIYNGFVFGNVPGVGIVTTFSSGISGVGAYIQANNLGPFSATITLFDQSNNPLGSFTANGVSNGVVGTALFIGASNSTGGVYSAQFDVTDVNGTEDFAIGTVNFNSTIPEPSSLLLFGSSALGLAGVIRRCSVGVGCRSEKATIRPKNRLLC